MESIKMKNITMTSRLPMLGRELNSAEIASFNPLCFAKSLRGLSTRMTLSDFKKLMLT